MKAKTTPSKKVVSKTKTKKRRKKIYLNDVAWYYEDDPFDKQKMIGAVELLKDLDISILQERDKKAKQQPEESKVSTE